MKTTTSFNNQLVYYFHKEIEQEKHHRYKSWEHCFLAFQEKNDKNTLSLHLGFYLASWGMYRGSSMLLNRDYKVHENAVKILSLNKYKPLHCSNTQDVSNENISLIIELKDELSIHYKENGVSPTDTLISKIMLGTFGCVPAYDRFFNKGLKLHGINAQFNESSLNQLFDFVTNNSTLITEAQKEITKSSSVYYPIMKLVDMYFWSLGFKEEKKK